MPLGQKSTFYAVCTYLGPFLAFSRSLRTFLVVNLITLEIIQKNSKRSLNKIQKKFQKKTLKKICNTFKNAKTKSKKKPKKLLWENNLEKSGTIFKKIIFFVKNQSSPVHPVSESRWGRGVARALRRRTEDGYSCV